MLIWALGQLHRHCYRLATSTTTTTAIVVLFLSLSSLSSLTFAAASTVSSFTTTMDIPNHDTIIRDIINTKFGNNVMDDHNRKLLKETPTYECDEVITTTTVEEISLIADYYVNILFSGDNEANIGFLDIAKQQLFAALKYKIRVVKLCMTCEQAKESGLLLSEEDDDDRYSFNKYCNEEEYGYDAIHSTLGFFPVDPETDEIFVDKKLRTVMTGHQTIFNLEYTPTENWLQDWGSYLTSTDPPPNPTTTFLKTVDHIVQAVAAGSGAIALNPDYLGYGESYITHNRTYFGEETYCQSFILGFLAAKKYLADNSPCTVMEDVVSTTGYSEGGYASTVAAFAFRQLGIKVWGHYPGAVPMNPSTQFSYVYDLFANDAVPEDEGTLLGMKAIVPLVGYAYSNEFPFLPNTGSGQNILADEWVSTTQDWFNAPSIVDASFVAQVPDVVTDILNPDMTAMFESAKAAGVTDPCPDFATEGATDKICEALQQANLWSELDSDRTDFTVIYCHSPDDNIVTFDNVPSSFDNDNISLYSGLLPFLNPTGQHTAASVFCAISPLVIFSSVVEDGPISISDSDASCTEPPTSPPSDSEASDNSTGGAVVSATVTFAAALALLSLATEIL